jgi:hypothetical protein
MVQIPQPASSEMIGQNDWENLSEWWQNVSDSANMLE